MSPRPTEKSDSLREEVRRRIIQGALLLFARQGYDRTSVKQIATEVGMAQGLLYHYFESKDHLLRAIFEECMTQVQLSFQAGDDSGSPTERLERIVRRSFELLRAMENFWRLSYAVRLQPTALTEIAPLLGGWIGQVLHTFEECFHGLGAIHPEASARLLFAAIDGASQHYVLQPDSYPLDRVAEEIIRRFCTLEREHHAS